MPGHADTRHLFIPCLHPNLGIDRCNDRWIHARACNTAALHSGNPDSGIVYVGKKKKEKKKNTTDVLILRVSHLH